MSRKISAAQAVTSCGQRGGATSASPAHYGRGLRGSRKRRCTGSGAGGPPEAAGADPEAARGRQGGHGGGGASAAAAGAAGRQRCRRYRRAPLTHPRRQDPPFSGSPTRGGFAPPGSAAITPGLPNAAPEPAQIPPPLPAFPHEPSSSRGVAEDPPGAPPVRSGAPR